MLARAGHNSITIRFQMPVTLLPESSVCGNPEHSTELPIPFYCGDFRTTLSAFHWVLMKSTNFKGIFAPMPWRGNWTSCLLRLVLVSDGGDIGWTSLDIPIPRDTSLVAQVEAIRLPIRIEIGFFAHSTLVCLLISIRHHSCIVRLFSYF